MSENVLTGMKINIATINQNVNQVLDHIKNIDSHLKDINGSIHSEKVERIEGDNHVCRIVNSRFNKLYFALLTLLGGFFVGVITWIVRTL